MAPFALKPVKKFTSRKVAIARIWKALQTLLANVPPQAAHVAPKPQKATKSPAKGKRRDVARDGAKSGRNGVNIAREGSKKAEVLR